MKDTTLIESPKLAIQSSADGVWLMFTTADGKHANVNLPTFFGEGRTMNDATICQWAKEYVLTNVGEKDGMASTPPVDNAHVEKGCEQFASGEPGINQRLVAAEMLINQIKDLVFPSWRTP